MKKITDFKDIYNLFNSWSENCPPKLPNFNIRVPEIEKLKTYKLVTAFDKTLKVTPFEYDKNSYNLTNNMINRLNAIENIDKITESPYIITPYSDFLINSNSESSIVRIIDTFALPTYIGLMMTFPIHGSDISNEDETDILSDVTEIDDANIKRYCLLLSSLLLRTYYGNKELEYSDLENDKLYFEGRTTMGHFCTLNYADWLTDYLVSRGHNREQTKAKVLKFTKEASYGALLHDFSNGNFGN